MTIICIRQPGYLPNIGFFKKIQSSDVFVYLDDAQYAIRSWDNRNKIRNGNKVAWLTVPVLHPYHKKLNQVEISYTKDWTNNHINLIEASYSKAPHFNNYWGEIKSIIEKKWKKLIELNIALIEHCILLLEISTERRKSSELRVNQTGTKRLLEICKQLDADIYLSGSSGLDYLNEKIFLDEKIKVIYENFEHPIYNQLGPDFLPNMSIIDLLFNEGEKSVQILNNAKNF